MGAVTGGVHVLECRDKVGKDPGVVGVLDSVLLANLANFGSNVGIPSRTHTGEQMVLHLKVEATSEGTRDETTVSAGSLNLGLEPTHRLASLFVRFSRVAVGIFKVVGQRKQDRKAKGLSCSHDHNLPKGSPWISVREGCHNVGVDVQETQRNGKLSATLDEVIIHLHTDRKSTTLLEVKNLRVENRRKPVSRQHGKEKESLETMQKRPGGVVQRIIIEK